MNFTREPILETIITPKEGYKIVLRNSKLQTEEEYSVDAVEIVSFGSAIFYRSLERPKPFLLPTTDYEVCETKDVRMVLKTEPVEKNIKIGGGKKPVPVPPPVPQEDAQSRKRRTRRRRMPDEVDAETKVVQPPKEKEASAPAAPAQPPRQMLPPPSSLISDHLSRYKNYQIAERTTVVTEEKAPVEMIEEPHVDECHACDDEDTSTDISFLIDDELLKRD